MGTRRVQRGMRIEPSFRSAETSRAEPAGETGSAARRSAHGYDIPRGVVEQETGLPLLDAGPGGAQAAAQAGHRLRVWNDDLEAAQPGGVGTRRRSADPLP